MRKDTIRLWLGKRLDNWSEKHDTRDERYSAVVNRGIDAMAHRPHLRLLFYSFLSLTIIYWLLVLFLPFQVLGLFELLSEWTDKGAGLAIFFVVLTGSALTYSIFRFKFPDIEGHRAPAGTVMSSYTYHRTIERRFRIWLFSIIGGVVNFFALLIVELFRLGNWYRPE